MQRIALIAPLLSAVLTTACASPTVQAPPTAPKTLVQHLNPEGLTKNPAFSQAVAVAAPARMVYVGGQNGIDASGTLVGKGDLGAQTEQALKNLETALAAGGARLEHVVKWTVYAVQGQKIEPGFAAFQKVWNNRPNPPAISMVFVSGLAQPDWLVEIEAVAAVPHE